jgi:hypothetical protein
MQIAPDRRRARRRAERWLVAGRMRRLRTGHHRMNRGERNCKQHGRKDNFRFHRNPLFHVQAVTVCQSRGPPRFAREQRYRSDSRDEIDRRSRLSVIFITSDRGGSEFAVTSVARDARRFCIAQKNAAPFDRDGPDATQYSTHAFFILLAGRRCRLAAMPAGLARPAYPGNLHRASDNGLTATRQLCCICLSGGNPV